MKRKRTRRAITSILSTISALVLIVFSYIAFTFFQIVAYSATDITRTVDAAVVLGAAAYGSKPSPVFRERINHAIALYKKGWCRFIVFTGGKKFADDRGEALTALRYAVKKGVREEDIIAETESRNTVENLSYMRPLLAERNIKSIVLVSDPLHMKRTALIADDLGLDYQISPTPTTKFRSLKIKAVFMFKEIYNITEYRLYRLFYGIR